MVDINSAKVNSCVAAGRDKLNLNDGSAAEAAVVYARDLIEYSRIIAEKVERTLYPILADQQPIEKAKEAKIDRPYPPLFYDLISAMKTIRFNIERISEDLDRVDI